MKPEHIVAVLLENEPYGPPAPDSFTNAVGSTRHLRSLHQQQIALMVKLDTALQLERQLKKIGVKRDQVMRYVRADEKYPQNYRMGRPNRGTLPPDALVGMHLNDGREIVFDMAVFPEHA